MPIFSSKLSILRNRINEEQEMMGSIKNSLKEDYDNSLSAVMIDPVLKKELKNTIDKHIQKTVMPFDVNLKKLKKDTKHLNLKWQIKHIFGSLILSLILIMIAHTDTPDFKYTDVKIDWLSIASIILSVSLFIYALYRIWTLICIVVDHNSDQNTTQESKTVGQEIPAQ
jgi:hypothetical protein